MQHHQWNQRLLAALVFVSISTGCSLFDQTRDPFTEAVIDPNDPNNEPLAADGPTEIIGSGRPLAAKPGQSLDEVLGRVNPIKPSRAWLDDQEAQPAGGRFLYRVKKAVSLQPRFKYEIDPSLGTPDLVTVALTPVAKSGKLDYRQMVAYTDFGSKFFEPGKDISITRPAESIVVQRQGERLSSVELQPNQKYQLVCTLTRDKWVHEIRLAFWTTR